MVKPTYWLAFIPRKALAEVRTGLSLLILTLLVYYALFRFPFWFPPRQRLWSLSYNFGFNNGVAIVGMLVLLGTVTPYLLRRRVATESKLPIAFQPTGGSTQKSLVVALSLAGNAGLA